MDGLTPEQCKRWKRLLRPPESIRCGILGCGMQFKVKGNLRVWWLTPDVPIPACPDCWKAMEIPMEIRDSKDIPQLKWPIPAKPAGGGSETPT